MLKAGIWKPSQIHSSTVCKRRAPVSYRLLKDADLKKPSSVGLFEFIVRDLRLSSGVFRTTYPGRFADLNALAAPFIASIGGGAPVEVHDWAASDCLASAEWAREIWRLSPGARMFASDILLNLIEVSRRDTGEAVIFEPGGAALQYVRPPFVIGFQSRISAFYPINRWFAARARRLAPEALRILRQSRAAEPAPLPAPWSVQPLSLVHPRARELAGSDRRFEIGSHSVFSPLPAACHVIRTMNIFNPGYFDERQLACGVQSVFESLVEGGVWIVGRTTEETQPPRNTASILRKSGGGFQVLTRLDGGSEIEALILPSQPEALRRP